MSSRSPSSVTLVTQPQAGVKTADRLLHWIVVALLIVSVIATMAYTALSIYIATQLVYVATNANLCHTCLVGFTVQVCHFSEPGGPGTIKGLVHTRCTAKWESDVAANHYHGAW